MATVQQVSFTDDWDGKELDLDDLNSVNFTIKGVEYHLDLRTANYERFLRDMTKWTDRAVKVGRTQRQRRSNVTPIHDKLQLVAIREWARNNGYDVADRGRIKQEVQEAFQAAHA